MISFKDKCAMYFKGEEAPMAFVDISVFGKSTDAQCTEMTKEICRILKKSFPYPQISFMLNTTAQHSGAGII